MEKLYRVVVNETAHYYVRCTADLMAKWLTMLDGTGKYPAVIATEVRMSDIDEINHNHFC